MMEEHKVNAAEGMVATKAITKRNPADKKMIVITILPLLAMLITVLQGVLTAESVIASAKTAIITLILTSSVTFYVRSFGEELLQKKLATTILGLGYLGAICLLLFVPGPGLLNFWMLGGLLVAMLFDNKLGLLIQFNMVFILGIAKGVSLETMIKILIICVLFSLLSGGLKDKSTVIYSSIIILSVDITLACAINNFAMDKFLNFQYLYSILSVLAVIVIAFIIATFYRKSGTATGAGSALHLDVINTIIANETDSKNQDSEAFGASGIETAFTGDQKQADAMEVMYQEAVNNDGSNIEAMKTEAAKTEATSIEAIDNNNSDAESHYLSDRTSYDVLCDEENLLLKKLKEFSESLYEHALLIGDISGRAAAAIGADEKLAKAGGYYHEIGKQNGKNYIEESLKLAEEYAFPKELRAILKEHNIKYDKPSSVEAAIVMLTDNIVSTIEYIGKTGDRKFTSHKIIENIFQMRMEKGTLDHAKISLMDYKLLKEFYKAEFMEGESNDN